jgi:FhaA, N-terminal domain/FHA domain
MSVLRTLETKIAGLVEGAFGRVFRSEVRPVELAHRLGREMESHKTVSLSRTYVPNEYVVWLSPQDRERYVGVEQAVGDELCAYLLEQARRDRLAMVARPSVEFRTDDHLRLGEFGIQTRRVKIAEDDQPQQDDHGHTMIYSASPVAEPAPPPRAHPGRAILESEGKRLVIGTEGAVIGRSRQCDVVLDDANVSRRHAEIRPTADGHWTVADLGSTNGVQINGRQTTGAATIASGDRLTFGTVEATFEVQ